MFNRYHLIFSRPSTAVAELLIVGDELCNAMGNHNSGFRLFGTVRPSGRGAKFREQSLALSKERTWNYAGYQPTRYFARGCFQVSFVF